MKNVLRTLFTRGILVSTFLISPTQSIAWPESTSEPNVSMNAESLIKILDLEAHVEGGFFRRTFQADHRDLIKTKSGDRFTMTSIYYLLSSDSPIGHFHLNKSDIAHFFHSGSAVQYYLIDPDGKLHSFILGNNPENDELFQFVVPGGWWKASKLIEDDRADYGLISEAVAPGFDYHDMTLGLSESMIVQFPQHEKLIQGFTRK